jgi:hypothetical protein
MSVKYFDLMLAGLLLAAAPLAVHAQPIAPAAVSKVLGVAGVVYKSDTKRLPSQTYGTHEYHTAGGDTVLHLTTAAADQYAGWKTVSKDFEAVPGLGTEAAFSKALAMLCARSSAKAACVMSNPVFYMTKPKPSVAQLKELLQQAL